MASTIARMPNSCRTRSRPACPRLLRRAGSVKSAATASASAAASSGTTSETRLARHDHVTMTGHVRGHDRETRRHGLEHRERESLLPRGGHVEIERRVDALGILEKAREDHLVGQAGRADQLSNPRLLAAVSDQDEDQTWQARPQPAEGVDERASSASPDRTG